MPCVADESRANYRLFGPDFEPPGDAWKRARGPGRLKYWKRVGELAVEAHRKQLRQAKDASGRKLAPVKQPRPDGADGPPLVPHRAESRTWRLLAFVEGEAGVTVFWRGHGRRSWSKIVRYHAEGRGRYGPIAVRDVIGLSPASQKWVKERAFAYWEATHPKAAPKPPTTAVPPSGIRPKRTAPAPIAARPAKPAPLPLSPEAEALVKRYPWLRKGLTRPGGY